MQPPNLCEFLLNITSTIPVMERTRRASEKVKRFRFVGKIERRKVKSAMQDALEVISDITWQDRQDTCNHVSTTMVGFRLEYLRLRKETQLVMSGLLHFIFYILLAFCPSNHCNGWKAKRIECPALCGEKLQPSNLFSI